MERNVLVAGNPASGVKYAASQTRCPNVFCFMDIGFVPCVEAIASAVPSLHVVFELFPSESPRTCQNFQMLCTGAGGQDARTGARLSYVGTTFHKVIPGFVAQGGDLLSRVGHSNNAVSAFGKQFADENLKRQHSSPGCLSMGNNGPNTNGSEFFVTLTKEAAYLDGKHCCFGRVVEGLDDFIKAFAVPNRVGVIVACGEGRGTPSESA